jgi:type I restriction enzyme S subunit
MSDSWPMRSVRALQDHGTILVEDGNHGEYRPRPDEFSAAGTPFIRAADMQDGQILFTSASRINEIALSRIRKGIGRPGDIILSHKGTVGKLAVAPRPCEHFVCSPQTTFWRVLDETVLDRRFLYFYMRSPQFARQLDAVKGETDMADYVSLTAQRRLQVLMPPLPLQLAIASILGALDDKIALNRRMNETLEATARAIFRDWFVDFGPIRAKMEGRAPYLASDIWSVFPDLLDDDGKPQGWEQVAAHEMVEFNPSERLLRGQPAPYLDMAALPTTGSWAEAPAKREFVSGSKFRNGDALLARITPCLENGKTAFVQNLDEGSVGWGSTEFIVMRARPPMPRAYSYILARDLGFRERAIQSMTGTSGRQRVQVDSVANFQIVKPNDEVARAFAELVSPSFEKLAANAREIETLAATRDLLLPKLISGEIRIRDAEKTIEAE